METVCPLCNGLSSLNAVCSLCGHLLTDGGALTDYVGPYSPYELTPKTSNNRTQCVHLMACPNCGNDSYAIIQNDVI